MIVCVKNSNSNLISAYVYEGYRRLYAASVDKNGNIPDFEAIRHDCIIHEKYNDRHEMMINFDDYYCDKNTYKKIIKELVEEPYIFAGGHTKHKLASYEKKIITMNLYMGCGPNTSFEGFKRIHKNELNKEFFGHLREIDD